MPRISNQHVVVEVSRQRSRVGDADSNSVRLARCAAAPLGSLGVSCKPSMLRPAVLQFMLS